MPASSDIWTSDSRGVTRVRDPRLSRCHRPAMPCARKLPADLETDPKKVLELLVGLPEVSVLGVDTSGSVVHLHVEKFARPVGCPTCGVVAQFRRLARGGADRSAGLRQAHWLHWHKRRWRCDDPDCAMGSWTEQDRVSQLRGWR